MHRMKIGLIAAIVLLALTAGLYAVVTRELKEAVVQELDTEVSRAQRIHGDVAQLEGDGVRQPGGRVLATARRSSACSTSPTRTAAGRPRSSSARRSTAELQHGRQAQGGHRRDARFVRQGAGARPERQRHVRRGPALEVPRGRQRRCRGKATKDVWTLQGRMNRVAVAPITQPDGTIRGALLVGYVLTARDAQMKHELLGTEVAFFHDGKVHTSSFISEGTGENAKEDGNKTQALNQVLFGSPDAPRPAGAAEERADAGLSPDARRSRVRGGRGAAARQRLRQDQRRGHAGVDRRRGWTRCPRWGRS